MRNFSEQGTNLFRHISIRILDCSPCFQAVADPDRLVQELALLAQAWPPEMPAQIHERDDHLASQHLSV
jgi:hypothetical protein